MLSRAEKSEALISSIEKEIQQLKEGHVDLEGSEFITPELKELKTENSKLKYQILHLKRSLEAEQAKMAAGGGDVMLSILGRIENLFEQVIDSYSYCTVYMVYK